MTCAMSPCCASMAILVLDIDVSQRPSHEKKTHTYPLQPSRADSQHLSLHRISATAAKDQIRYYASSSSSLTLLDELPFSPGGRGGTMGFV